MTAALASRIAPQERFPRPVHMTNGAGELSAMSLEASSVLSAAAEVVARASAAPALADEGNARPNAMAEFAKFVLTQWMAAFVTYEALAATIDRKGRYLPTLGL